MKRVLIVEDDGNIFGMLEKELGSSYELVRARAVDEARGYVAEDEPFDCFVVDLQIPPFGLTYEEMIDFEDREGYALLKNYLWTGNEEEIRRLRAKTIICSRYVPDFKEKYGEEVEDLAMVNKTKGFQQKVASLIKKKIL